VSDALRAGFADGWADPARLVTESRKARGLLDGSREAIADVMGVSAEQVHFTPSIHVAFERAIAGIARARRAQSRIIVSAIERDALMNAAAFALPQGIETIAVNSQGHLDIEAFAAAVSADGVALAAIQHANQEIGTVQRLDRIASSAAAAGVPLLIDASSSIGHRDTPQQWDALIAHPADWGGPAGLGVLALKPGTRWLPAWPEGDDWAPGGISVPLALASAVALQEREQERREVSGRMGALVERIRATVRQLSGIDVLGDPYERLPHIVTFSCLYVDGESLVAELDREGFAVGSGSACASGTLEPSRVLASIGALTHGNVRVALHPGVTSDDVDRFLAVLPQVLDRVRSRLGSPSSD